MDPVEGADLSHGSGFSLSLSLTTFRPFHTDPCSIKSGIGEDVNGSAGYSIGATVQGFAWKDLQVSFKELRLIQR